MTSRISLASLASGLVAMAAVAVGAGRAAEPAVRLPRVPNRLTVPRIAPLDPAALTGEQRAALGPAWNSGRIRNPHFLLTTVRNVPLHRAWEGFRNDWLNKSILPPRDRYLLLMRTAWLCGAEYNWWAHTDPTYARLATISDADIVRISRGPGDTGWTPFEAALVRAADELHAHQFIEDATWKVLKTKYGDAALMDVVFIVGQYTMSSMYFNTVGIQQEPAQ